MAAVPRLLSQTLKRANVATTLGLLEKIGKLVVNSVGAACVVRTTATMRSRREDR